MPHHVFRDGGFGSLNTQLEQLTVNAWRTPARVVAAHHPDQIPNLLRHAGPTWLAAADFPRPEQAKALTMPGDALKKTAKRTASLCFNIPGKELGGGWKPPCNIQQEEKTASN